MKTAIKYLSLIAVSLLVSCGNPAPTELYDDTTLQDNKGVKIGTPSTGGGYDSTGVSNQLIDKTTIISVSGIKNNNYGSYSPNESYYAQFNDKSKPIIIPIENKIGYRTKVMGNVFFKGIQAQIQPFILTYPINNLLKDTLVGSKYVLSSSMMIGHNNNNNSGFLTILKSISDWILVKAYYSIRYSYTARNNCKGNLLRFVFCSNNSDGFELGSKKHRRY